MQKYNSTNTEKTSPNQFTSHAHYLFVKIPERERSYSAMVVALGPGKFYGSSLPRPRIYTDVKLNTERIDPPTSVLDPFLSWAHEAHWSMGGLNFKRQRLQGRIEGSIKKLRAESERIIRTQKRIDSKQSSILRDDDDYKRPSSVSPPPAPISKKRRRYMALIDEEEEEEEEVRERKDEGYVRKKPARKLGDDFDRVAAETVNKREKVVSDGLKSVASRTRSQRSEKEVEAEEVNGSKGKSKKLKKGERTGKSDGVKGNLSPAKDGIRTSPRLSKRA